MISVLCQKENNHPYSILTLSSWNLFKPASINLSAQKGSGVGKDLLHVLSDPLWTWKRFSQVALTLQHYTSHRGFLQACLKVLVLVNTILVGSKPFDIRCRHIYSFEVMQKFHDSNLA